MKRHFTSLLFAFVLGVALSLVAGSFWRHNKDSAAAESPCDRKIDVALGHAILNGVPIFDKALQLASSNRVDDARRVLRNYAWWQLEEAWAINRKRDGALSNELDHVLISVYPGLRRQVDFTEFTNFPTDYLTEMTNFVRAADALTATKVQ